nr:MAG TPA: hypothetical protein [Caudoviricetes sp.]
MPDGGNSQLRFADCILIIEERTLFDPDTACPLNMGTIM